MKHRCLTILLVAGISAGAFAQENSPVKVEEIKDSRTTGEFFAELEINLALTAPGLESAKGIKVTVDKAVDETGADLRDPDRMRQGDFDPVYAMGGPLTVSLRLKNPARKSATLPEVSGKIELHVPDQDPESVVTVPNILAATGKPLAAEALKKSGVNMTVLTKKQRDAAESAGDADPATGDGPEAAMAAALRNAFEGLFQMEDNDICLLIEDPDRNIITFELQNSAGEKIETNGSMSMGGPEKQTKILSLPEPLPEDARLVVYLRSPKAIMVQEFQLKNLALP
jgi:hypothetical protein